jgi:Tol biopolymer transport system component
MNADGLGVRRVTFGSTPIDGPVWSPDGTKIAFAANIVGNWEIYIIGADGSGETNVTQDPGDDAHPAWSPDGTQIAFDSGRTGHRQIYTMTPAGTFLTPLTASTVYVSNPDWSPDGARIAYNAAGAVRAMLADGSKNYLVYDTLNPFLDVEPTWSPDGSEIAFSDDLADIGIVNPDGMGHAHITSGSTGDGAPSWQPPQCTVASVSSGDSFECAGGRRVRMLQIDAPDPGACGGDWAQAAMQYIFLKPGRTVGLKYDVATTDTDGRELAAPIWRGNDGMEYNLSIVMAYVGLAKAAVVGAVGQDRDTQRRNTLFLSWAQSSEAYAKAQQWNMWAPGKPFNGGC